jgi:hypothetical protein
VDRKDRRAFFIGMNPLSSLPEICRLVAEATSLEEGPPGVEALLRSVHKHQPVSPKDAAAELGLPIPIVSAIRRELEKHGWLVRKGGMVLSDEAGRIVSSIWGSSDAAAKRAPAPQRPAQPKPETVPLPPTPTHQNQEEDFEEGLLEEEEDSLSDSFDYIPLSLSEDQESVADEPFFELLDEIFEERPEADPRWDQSHATIETVLRRAAFFLEHGLVQGKRILFLGDDDLTSLVTLLYIRKELGEEALRSCMAVVVEADPRLTEFIEEMALGEDLPLAVIKADLREPLPKPLMRAFDFFFTDPPYTPEGVRLFLDRGCQALDPQGQRKAALAVPLSPPFLQAATQETLLAKGFVIDSLEPVFNHYLGATMQGGVSALYSLTLLYPGKDSGDMPLGPLYTAEAKSLAHRTSEKRPHKGKGQKDTQAREGVRLVPRRKRT